MPDPFAPDGDPCCPYPDTWSDAALAAAVAASALAVAAALIVGGMALGGWGWPGRRQMARRMALWSGGAATLVLGGWGIWALANRHEAYTRADCATFRFDPADWRSDSAADRMRAADGLAGCGALHGRPAAEVLRTLGPVPLRRARRGERFAVYDLDAPARDGVGRYLVTTVFERGRLARAVVGTSSESD